MTQQLDAIIQRLYRLAGLPEREQQRIASQMRILLDSAESPALAPSNDERTPGLGKGDIVISEDFDAPLPESFWLGEG
jgi:hypothetical protein